MKNFIILAILTSVFFSSCTNGEQNPPYVYESNPQYSWGYAEFFGSYYADYGNINNTVSLSLFSDSLTINSNNNLEGYGQYLFLEDIFIAPNDTLPPAGTYTINKSGEPFTVTPGQYDSIDNEVYTLGATISYYEPNTANSTLKIITSGTFTLDYVGSTCNINCNFLTADNFQLKGSFSAQLPYLDESLSPQKENLRKKLNYIFK